MGSVGVGVGSVGVGVGSVGTGTGSGIGVGGSHLRTETSSTISDLPFLRRLAITRTLRFVPECRVVAVMVTLRQALTAANRLEVFFTARPLEVSRRMMRPPAEGWVVRM